MSNCRAIYIAAGVTGGSLFKDVRRIRESVFLFIEMHLVKNRICGRLREQKRAKHRDVQTVGADSLWRFRMRIYVLVRDVNNARDAAINPQRDPLPSLSLLSPLCRKLSRSRKLSFIALYCRSYMLLLRCHCVS